jgi:hypothetical protein
MALSRRLWAAPENEPGVSPAASPSIGLNRSRIRLQGGVAYHKLPPAVGYDLTDRAELLAAIGNERLEFHLDFLLLDAFLSCLPSLSTRVTSQSPSTRSGWCIRKR